MPYELNCSFLSFKFLSALISFSFRLLKKVESLKEDIDKFNKEAEQVNKTSFIVAA